MYLLKLDFLIFISFSWYTITIIQPKPTTEPPPPIIQIVMMMMITAGYVKLVSSYYICSCELLKKLASILITITRVNSICRLKVKRDR